MIPILSIIVPVYNVADYLPRCMDSILSQSFADFEVLLVDDGSTDGSGDICDAYPNRDSRVRVFHKENGGVSSARNIGLEKSKGEWITFVDADDYLDDGYFDVPFNDSIDLFVRNWCFIGSVISDYCPPETVVGRNYWPYLQENAHRDRYRIILGLFYKHRMVQDLRFDERFRLGEDTLFMMDYLASCHSLQVLDGACYRYQRFEGWKDKYRLNWNETQAYLNAFWSRYVEFPVEIPKLPAFIFPFFYRQADREGIERRWALSVPVLKYKRTQLPFKGIKFRMKYLLCRFLSLFIHV